MEGQWDKCCPWWRHEGAVCVFVCVRKTERENKEKGTWWGERKMKKEGIEKRCEWVSMRWKEEQTVDTCLAISWGKRNRFLLREETECHRPEIRGQQFQTEDPNVIFDFHNCASDLRRLDIKIHNQNIAVHRGTENIHDFHFNRLCGTSEVCWKPVAEVCGPSYSLFADQREALRRGTCG